MSTIHILTSAQASVQAGGHRLCEQLRGVAAAAAAGAGPGQAADQAVALEQGARAAAAPHKVLELETNLRDVSSCTIVVKVLTIRVISWLKTAITAFTFNNLLYYDNIQ